MLKAIERQYLLPVGRRMTAPLRCDPSFVVIGAMKGGTTSLYRYLSESPQITMAHVKEVNYFALYPDRSMAWYRSHFPLRITNRSKASGEASPYYLYHPYAAERLAQAYPDSKLMILLRDPTARAISHYVAMASADREPLQLLEAIEREMSGPGTPERVIRQGGPELEQSMHRVNSYVGRGFYAEQLDRWLEYFPRSAMFIRRSEDLFAEPRPFMHDVTRFLEVEDLPESVQFKIYNPGHELPASRKDEDLSMAVKRLREIYHEPNIALFERYAIRWDNISDGERVE